MGIVKSQCADGNVEDVYSHWDDFQIQNPNIPIRCTDIRLATEEEKQRAIDELKAKGLWWNAKEKKIEKIRWRAEKGEIYFTINLHTDFKIIFNVENYSPYTDNVNYEYGNYFRTYAIAQKAIGVIKERLRKFYE